MSNAKSSLSSGGGRRSNAPALLTPVDTFPVHVEQPKIIWLQYPHRPRHTLRICPVPRVFRQQVLRLPEKPARDRSRANCVLHLRFRRQAIALQAQVIRSAISRSLPPPRLSRRSDFVTPLHWVNALLLAQPVAIGGCHKPRSSHRRQIRHALVLEGARRFHRRISCTAPMSPAWRQGQMSAGFSSCAGSHDVLSLPTSVIGDPIRKGFPGSGMTTIV